MGTEPSFSSGADAAAQDARKRLHCAVVGRAWRQANQRAIAAKLAGRDWNVLAAIQSLTLSYHRLTDRISSKQLSETAGLSRRDLYVSLHRLEDASVIVWHRSGGRKPAQIGFLAAPQTVGRAPDSTRDVAVGNITDSSGNPTVVESTDSTVGGSADTSFKGLPIKTPAASTASAKRQTAGAATNDEPQEFTTLVDGIRVAGAGREAVLDAWLQAPDGVARCVEDVRDRMEFDCVDRPGGLLVQMVRDGDHVLWDDEEGREGFSIPSVAAPGAATLPVEECDQVPVGDGSLSGLLDRLAPPRLPFEGVSLLPKPEPGAVRDSQLPHVRSLAESLGWPAQYDTWPLIVGGKSGWCEALALLDAAIDSPPTAERAGVAIVHLATVLEAASMQPIETGVVANDPSDRDDVDAILDAVWLARETVDDEPPDLDDVDAQWMGQEAFDE